MKTSHFCKRNVYIMLVLMLYSFIPLHATPIIPKILGDNMVLQRGQPVPVWGWDTPGETVTIKFMGQTKSAVADKTGRWMVKLAPLKESSTEHDMIISTASGQKKISGILVGEVWLCSGQSNMQWAFLNYDEKTYGAAIINRVHAEKQNASYPLIRLFSN